MFNELKSFHTLIEWHKLHDTKNEINCKRHQTLNETPKTATKKKKEVEKSCKQTDSNWLNPSTLQEAPAHPKANFQRQQGF